MNTTHTRARAALACLTGAVTVIAAAVAMTGTTPAAARAATARARTGLPVTSPGSLPALPSRPVSAGPGHVVPMWRLPRGAQPGRNPGQQAAPDTIGEPGGYDPGELRAYLGLRGTGAGQTVAVTEAFDVQNPLPVSLVGEQDDVTNSLAVYDSWYGLRPACSATVTTGCFSLTFTAPHGTSTSDPGDAFLNWRQEAVLDVELIHALAPRAAIVVVEARTDTKASLMTAIDYARSLHPAAVSNSWGVNESAGEPGMNGHCPATGPPCVFSSGDTGNYATCLAENGPGASCGGYPAANPGVLAVGGTTLDLAPTGKVRSETAWTGSGGGISGYEPFPGYQRNADRYPAGRGIPDVSFDADPNSGVAVYMSFLLPCSTGICDYEEWEEFGGTSVGAPAWSAILASAAQQRAAAGEPPLTTAAVHAAVYARTAGKPIADITTGVNGICGAQCSAGPGYDLVTGMGSPRPRIVSYLARSPR
jgi:subtilase family serine protease